VVKEEWLVVWVVKKRKRTRFSDGERWPYQQHYGSQSEAGAHATTAIVSFSSRSLFGDAATTFGRLRCR
jgi:hypothetical protein